MHEKGILPEDIKSVEDLEKLPFTTKQDLRKLTVRLVCVPFGRYSKDPRFQRHNRKANGCGLYQNDIALWAELIARCLTMTGADKSSVVQVSYGTAFLRAGLVSIRCRACRGIHRSHILRQHAAADYDNEGFRLDGAVLYSVVCPLFSRNN